MRPRARLLLVALLALSGSLHRAARAEEEALPVDPALVQGELENGLRYVVRRHDHPPGRAVVWLHVHSGSLNETERQRGIAHYLEHMAFNGSKNHPPGTLVPFFQSLGMTFGRDQNAFTNLQQTTYQLSLPDAKPATLAKAMTFFADVLHRLLLLPEEIDAERQIIQEERRTGLSGRRRVRDTVMKRIAPGSIYGERDTIGTEQTIDAFTVEDFRDYYGRWYTASNATLLVVADADPEVVVKAVRAGFGDAPKTPRPTPQASGVVAYEKSFAIVATDPEIDSEEVRIVRVEPVRPPTTTVPRLRADLALALGTAALNRRFEDLCAGTDTCYRSARASSDDEPQALHTWEVSARVTPGRWRSALEEVALELQRARRFGFSAREVEDGRREMLADAARSVETAPTTPALFLIRRMNGYVTDGEPILSPAQRLDLLERLLPAITTEEVAKRFAEEFDPRAVAFVAVLPAGPAVPTEAQLLEVGTRALAVPPTPRAEVERATSLLAEPPKPGEWKDGEDHAATGVWSGWLSNGVRVHHRFLDTRKDEVSVTITLYGAELLETAENRGITSVAQVAWSQPATQRLSSSDVRALMIGRNVSVRAGDAGGGGRGGRRPRGGGSGGGPASATLVVSGSPADLETGLQLAHLLLREPKVEPQAFLQHRSTAREALLEASKNPMQLGMRLAGVAQFPGDDVRLQPVTPEQLDRVTPEAAQAWIDRLVAESPIEVAVVGDLPKDRALELVARYLGSLPERARVGPETRLAERTLKRPTGPRRVDREVATPTPQAFVLSGFYGADEKDLADARALTMAARVLSTRMTREVREQAQLVYSIGASSRSAATFPGFGVFVAAAPTDPHKAGPLVEKLASMYEAFAKSGPTDEELSVAKRQFANGDEEQRKDPAWWTARLEQMTFRGTRLDDVAAEPAALQALTAAQVKEAFAKYAKPEHAIVVTVVPEKTGG